MAEVSAAQSTSSTSFWGMGAMDLVKVFQTFVDTVGKVFQAYIQLEAMDANINAHASGIASSDRTQQAKQIKDLDSQLKIDHAKDADKQKELKQKIIADTANVGITGNQATIAAFANSPSINQTDLAIAMQHAEFTASDKNSTPEKTTEDIQKQHQEVRDAQNRVLLAIAKDKPELKDQGIISLSKDDQGNEHTSVNYKKFKAYMESSPAGETQHASLTEEQRNTLDIRLQRFEDASSALATDYAAFQVAGGINEGAAMDAETKAAMTRGKENGKTLDFYDVKKANTSDARHRNSVSTVLDRTRPQRSFIA